MSFKPQEISSGRWKRRNSKISDGHIKSQEGKDADTHSGKTAVAEAWELESS